MTELDTIMAEIKAENLSINLSYEIGAPDAMQDNSELGSPHNAVSGNNSQLGSPYKPGGPNFGFLTPDSGDSAYAIDNDCSVRGSPDDSVVSVLPVDVLHVIRSFQSQQDSASLVRKLGCVALLPFSKINKNDINRSISGCKDVAKFQFEM